MNFKDSSMSCPIFWIYVYAAIIGIIFYLEEKKNFTTIHDLFPLTKIQKDIDKYMKLKTKNQILAKSYFIFSFILKSLLNLNKQIIYLAPANLNIFQKNMIKSPKNLLPLKFTLNCDARIFDADIAKNCTMYQYRNDLGFCTSALMNIIHEKNIKTDN